MNKQKREIQYVSEALPIADRPLSGVNASTRLLRMNEKNNNFELQKTFFTCFCVMRTVDQMKHTNHPNYIVLRS